MRLLRSPVFWWFVALAGVGLLGAAAVMNLAAAGRTLTHCVLERCPTGRPSPWFVGAGAALAIAGLVGHLWTSGRHHPRSEGP